MKQKQRGGKRDGSGRKPLAYKTKTMRVPLPIVPKVQKQIETFKAKNK